MKKILISAVALISLFSFAACSDSREAVESIQSVTTTIEPVFVEHISPEKSEEIQPVTEITERSAQTEEKTLPADTADTNEINDIPEDIDILETFLDEEVEIEESENYIVPEIVAEYSSESLTAVTIEEKKEHPVYIKTSAVPESAYEYAQKMFSSFTRNDLVYMGFTKAEANSSVLAEGFCIKSLKENAYKENIFYFPVLCDGKITALMTVTYDNGQYGFSFGKDDMSAAMNELITSGDNAAEIYVSSAVYGVTDNGVTILAYGVPYNESVVEDEIAYLENQRKEGDSQAETIIVSY